MHYASTSTTILVGRPLLYTNKANFISAVEGCWGRELTVVGSCKVEKLFDKNFEFF